jgi:hypothetical protein
MSFVAGERRYAVTAYLPAETNLEELPEDVSAMLGSIRFLYDPRAASRWATATVENIAVPIPPQWTRRNEPASAEVLATWGTREQDTEATFQVTKSLDVRRAVSRVRPTWKTMGLLAGRHPATAYYGRAADGRSDVMVVLLDYPEADGRWTVFVCQTASQDWHRYETAFHQMISGTHVSGSEPRPPRAKPAPKGQLGSYPKLDYLAGDCSYSLVSCKTGVIVRQLDTDRVETVWTQPATYPTDPIFKAIIEGNAELARRLGGAVTERVPLFEDTLRIQVFDGGVMISETAFRRHWWCYHDLRSEQ